MPPEYNTKYKYMTKVTRYSHYLRCLKNHFLKYSFTYSEINKIETPVNLKYYELSDDINYGTKPVYTSMYNELKGVLLSVLQNLLDNCIKKFKQLYIRQQHSSIQTGGNRVIKRIIKIKSYYN